MPRSKERLITLPLTLLLFAVLAGEPLSAAQLEAGIGVGDITPPVPFRMSGYFEERISTGIKDPLRVKAVVFRQGETTAAIVFCDLLGVPLEVSTPARQLAARKTGIPAANIVIAATHSHTAPLYFDSLRNYFHQSAIASQGNDPYEVIDYPKELVDRIVRAIVEAKEQLQPVELTTLTSHANRLAFNRRFHMRNGTVECNPGLKNPDIIRAAGPVDPEVGAVFLRPLNQTGYLGAIVSFALHLDTVGGTEYSADYPKHCEDRLRHEFGPDFTLLFGAGTCGDINHLDVLTETKRSSDEIGRVLADSILQEVTRQSPSSSDDVSLAVRHAKVNVALQEYSSAEIDKAQKNMSLTGSRHLSFLEQVEAYKITDLQLRQGDILPIEVQLFRLTNDAAIITLPGEVFVELGMAIKRASPFKTTIVVQLANDYPAYIPTKRAFVEGSYETINSRVKPGAGEQMVDAAIELMREVE